MNEDLQRLARVLDAYGGDPERWPDEERESLLSLAAQSHAARELIDEASRTDALLAMVAPTSAMSPGLADRIVDTAAAAPTPRPRAWRRWTPLIPLAAAAGLALWLSLPPTAPPTDSQPRYIEMAEITDLGNYETPTDVLLAMNGFDSLQGVPAYSCEESELGCLDLNFDFPEPDRQSSRKNSRRWTT